MELNELLSDEDFVSDVIALDSVEKIYEISKRYDYSGTIEDLKREILDLIFRLQDEESESVVAGVGNKKNRIIASTLAGVTLFGTITPNLYAEGEDTRNESLKRSTTLNAELNSFGLNFGDRKTLKNIGLGALSVATLGALLVGGRKYLNNRKVDNCANNSEKMGDNSIRQKENARSTSKVKPKVNTEKPTVQEDDQTELKEALALEILKLKEKAATLELNLLKKETGEQNEKEMTSAARTIVKILANRLTSLYADLYEQEYILPQELEHVEDHNDYFSHDVIYAVYVELYCAARYALSWCEWYYREGRKQDIDCELLIAYTLKLVELIVKFFKDSIERYDDLYTTAISKSYSELNERLRAIWPEESNLI